MSPARKDEMGMIKEYVVKITDEVIPDAFARFESDFSPEGEIIRCKNCKWHSEKGFCKHPNGGAGNIRPVNWFCADGECKDGEQDD